jgi:hypothetical protein
MELLQKEGITHIVNLIAHKVTEEADYSTVINQRLQCVTN